MPGSRRSPPSGKRRCAARSSRPTTQAARRRRGRMLYSSLDACAAADRAVRARESALRAALRAQQPPGLGARAAAGHPRAWSAPARDADALRSDGPAKEAAMDKRRHPARAAPRVPARRSARSCRGWRWPSLVAHRRAGWSRKIARFAVVKGLRAINFNVLTERAGIGRLPAAGRHPERHHG